MRVTVMHQTAKGLGPPGFEPREIAVKQLERIKWFLWNGNTFRALQTVGWLYMDIDVEAPTKKQQKLIGKLEEFETYIRNNAKFIPNYGERYRYGETISTVCGIDHQPGGKQANGEKTTDALESARCPLAAPSSYPRSQ